MITGAGNFEKPLFGDGAVEELNDIALGFSLSAVLEAIKEGDKRVIKAIREVLPYEGFDHDNLKGYIKYKPEF